MDVLYIKWRAKLIGVLTDDENTMIGRHARVITRLINCVNNDVLRIASDQHCGQGNNRGHRQRCLGQACLHIFDLLTHAGQPDHRHERQVPKEDESLGALGPPAELLQVILSPAPGAHQG